MSKESESTNNDNDDKHTNFGGQSKLDEQQSGPSQNIFPDAKIGHVGDTHYHYHGYKRNESTYSTISESPPRTIDNLRKPRNDFKKTECFEKILLLVDKETVLVLHCVGLPGGGKTQLIRRLAFDFPFEKEELIIKFHVSCKDKGENVLDSFKRLTELLRTHHFLDQDRCQAIQSKLETPSATDLVDVLYDSDAAVVIVIEDHEKTNHLLREVVRCLEIKSKRKTEVPRSAKFHVYITSRNRSSVFSQEEVCKMQKSQMPYIVAAINGFNQDEAVDYLCDGEETDQKKYAIAIYERFSGLPLALQMVKRYCKQMVHIDYKKYIANLSKTKSSEARVMRGENEAVTHEYESDGTHMFYRIVNPLWNINDQYNDDCYHHWNFVSCLSHLHHKCIPSMVLEHFYSSIHNESQAGKGKPSEDDDDFELQMNRFLNHLVKQSTCTRTDNQDICFEKVVANAFVVTRREETKKKKDDFNSLKTAVTYMSSLLKLEEIKGDQQALQKLRPHLEHLRDNAKKDPSITKSDTKTLDKALQQLDNT